MRAKKKFLRGGRKSGRKAGKIMPSLLDNTDQLTKRGGGRADGGEIRSSREKLKQRFFLESTQSFIKRGTKNKAGEGGGKGSSEPRANQA